MSLIRALLVALVSSALYFTVSCVGPAQAQQSIQISELKESYELTVPISRLVMTIPKAGLTQGKNTRGGSADSPRYFYFEDRNLRLIISGWFERGERFAGIKKYWESQTEAWSRNGLRAPQDVSFLKLEGWDAIVYDMPVPLGSNPHIRAHWVQAGTWIDLHLSVTSDRPSVESRDKLMAMLKTIKVRKKN